MTPGGIIDSFIVEQREPDSFEIFSQSEGMAHSSYGQEDVESDKPEQKLLEQQMESSDEKRPERPARKTIKVQKNK